jgi:hypothetical protein
MLDTVPRRSRVDEPTTPLTLRLPTELLDRLRLVADDQDRSLNAQVVRALREWLERYARMNSRRLSRESAHQLADLQSALARAQNAPKQQASDVLDEAEHAAILLAQRIRTELNEGSPGSFDEGDLETLNRIIVDISLLAERPAADEIRELVERVERLSR